MAELRRSVAYSAAQSYFGVAMQLVSTVVLSRILTPTEVGVFAVATVFAALAVNFRDFGIAEYLIQAKQLSTQNIQAAFAVNIALSWAMGLAIFAGAGFVAEFYRSASIADVMRVQAFNFLLIPFGAINQAWFRRELNFKPLFVAGLLSDVVTLVVAITLALHGFGAMSLAWSSLAGIVITVAVSLYFRPADFPRWPSLRGIGEVLRFGSFASGIYVLGQLGKGAPEMIIGRVLGVAEVAIFSRGGGLVQLFRQLVIKAIMPVCLPYFSKSLRDGHSVNLAYMQAVSIFTCIGWPVLGFLAMAAFPAIHIVYGDQWTAAVPLARILCVAAAIELVHQLAKEALMSNGRVKLATRLQLTLQIAQIVGLSVVVPFGLLGACWGILAASLVGLALSQWHLRSGTAFRMVDLWAACRKSLLVLLITLTPTALFFELVPSTAANFVRNFLLGGALTAAFWLAAMRITGHPLWVELGKASLLIFKPRVPAAKPEAGP